MKRVFIVLGALVILAGAYFGFTRFQTQREAAAASGFQTEPARRGSLTATAGATGTVRANQSAVLVWETSGTVAEISAEAGDQVQAQRVLASLSPTSLSQNIILAQAELVSAQKELDNLLNSQLARAQALQALDDAQRALEGMAINTQFQLAQVQLDLVNARDALDDAQYGRDRLNYARARQSTIDAAEANYILAQSEVDRLQKEFNKVAGRKEDDPVRALALSNLAAAQQQRDATLRKLNWYKGSPGEQEISEADANLAMAEARLADAENEWERIRTGPNPAEVALLEARLAEAQREWDRIKDGPDPDDISAAQARVEAAQATLALAQLTAPFSGTLTEVHIKPGDQISPGSVSFRLDDLSRLLVDVQVSEVDINRIHVGQPVLLTFDAILGREYQGEIREVGLVGNNVQGTVNFNVTVEITEPDRFVLPGMTAAVNIVTSELDDVLLVPNRAVRVREGKRVVYVLKEGVPEPVEITLGASSETVSEVVSGNLQIGDPIVLNPPSDPIFFGGPPGNR